MTNADFVSALVDGFLTAGAPSLTLLAATVGALIVAAGHKAATAIARRIRPIPAAPDNFRGTDTQALWTCRRIHAQPLAAHRRKEKPQP